MCNGGIHSESCVIDYVAIWLCLISGWVSSRGEIKPGFQEKKKSVPNCTFACRWDGSIKHTHCVTLALTFVFQQRMHLYHSRCIALHIQIRKRKKKGDAVHRGNQYSISFVCNAVALFEHHRSQPVHPVELKYVCQMIVFLHGGPTSSALSPIAKDRNNQDTLYVIQLHNHVHDHRLKELFSSF